MLDGSGDTDGDVEVGCHHFAGLADLVVVGHEAGVDRGARGADGGAQLVGDALQPDEIIAALHAAAARDDDARGCQLRALRLGALLALERREPGVAAALDRPAGRPTTFGPGGAPGPTAHG